MVEPKTQPQSSQLGRLRASLLAIAAITGVILWSLAHNGSATRAVVLTIVNFDGPVANILVDGQKVATLACWDEPVTLARGDPGVTELPWSIEILDISASPATRIGSSIESGGGSESTIVIRADHLEWASTPPQRDPSCPPAPSGEPLY